MDAIDKTTIACSYPVFIKNKITDAIMDKLKEQQSDSDAILEELKEWANKELIEHIKFHPSPLSYTQGRFDQAKATLNTIDALKYKQTWDTPEMPEAPVKDNGDNEKLKKFREACDAFYQSFVQFYNPS